MTLAARFGIIAVLALALAAAAGAQSTAPTATPARDAELVYAKGGDVYVRSGNAVRRITRDRFADGMPAWSPDRKRIVFVRNGDVYVMRADGTQQRRLTRGRAADLYPTFSPDGKLIAFSSTRGDRESEIYVMRTDGSHVRRITHTARHVDNVQPAFSPDGRYIVFTSTRIAYWNYELFRVRAADGKALKRLTFWGTGGDGQPGDDIMPSYSPDGKRIAFVSDRGGGYGVWTMNAADGKGLRLVTRHARQNHAFPRFSPDGRSLVYMTFSPNSQVIDGRLWTVAANGSNRRPLGRGAEPDW